MLKTMLATSLSIAILSLATAVWRLRWKRQAGWNPWRGLRRDPPRILLPDDPSLEPGSLPGDLNSETYNPELARRLAHDHPVPILSGAPRTRRFGRWRARNLLDLSTLKALVNMFLSYLGKNFLDILSQFLPW